MRIRMLGQLALGLAMSVAGLGTAHAAPPVERSGNTYNVAACARGQGQGVARCFAHVRSDVHGNPMAGKPTPNATPSGYSPANLRSAYAVTATGSSSTTVAIVDAYGYPNASADLAVYRAQFGLSACTTSNGCLTVVNQSGGTSLPRYNSGWAQEQALDLDMVSAMCPNCKILLVQASSASYANLAAAVNTAAAKGALVISNSYGGGESGTTSYNSAYTHPGLAITVSTGDSGYGVQFPASSPGVIAVGGTHLTTASNSRGWAETAWTSGGSGCSTVYAKPSFQSDPSCAMRMEADISAVADPATGVAVYGPTGQGSQSGWLVFGGTSVAAPLIGGIYGALGHGASNGASAIYAAPTSAFNDVTSGSNGSCGGTYFCVAGGGYDGPTGRGTPAGSGAF